MYCQKCGNHVNDNDAVCDTCGNQIKKDVNSESETKSGLKTASIILGIASIIGAVLIITSPLGVIEGIVGLILGIIALKKVKNPAGIILNSVGLVLSIIVIIAVTVISINAIKYAKEEYFGNDKYKISDILGKFNIDDQNDINDFVEQFKDIINDYDGSNDGEFNNDDDNQADLDEILDKFKDIIESKTNN